MDDNTASTSNNGTISSCDTAHNPERKPSTESDGSTKNASSSVSDNSTHTYPMSRFKRRPPRSILLYTTDSMMRTKLEDLPVFALEPLGKYLTVSDLNSCCSVSRPWYKIFIQNQFWKRHCNGTVVDYLKSHPSEVGNISTVLAEDPHISRMSEWRANFVYQNQLRGNWINKRCNVESITFPELENNECFSFHNDYVFFSHPQHLDVWKITQVPIHITKITCKPTPVINDNEAIANTHIFDTDDWEASNDRIVFAPCNLVSVYDISKVQDDCPVSFSFLFDKTEEESFTATQTSNFQCNLACKMEESENEFAVIGDIFIGLSHCPLKSMHIWNIETKKKLKVEKMLMDQMASSIYIKQSSTKSDCVVIKFVRSTKAMFSSYYRIYNIKKLEFLPLEVYRSGHSNFWFDVSNEYFYLIDTDLFTKLPCLTVYDCNHESKMVVEYLLHHGDKITLVGNNVISYGCEGCTVLNIPSGRSNVFGDPCSYHAAYEFWDNFAAVKSNFFPYSRGRINKDCLELWYLGKDYPKHIFRHLGKYLSLSHSFTKLYILTKNKILVYSFW